MPLLNNENLPVQSVADSTRLDDDLSRRTTKRTSIVRPVDHLPKCRALLPIRPLDDQLPNSCFYHYNFCASR